jgi:hypothetical protein
MADLKPRLLKFAVCKTDFDIWDRVLAKCRPMRLETLSRASDQRDAQVMWAAEKNPNLGLLWPYEVFGTGWPRDIEGEPGPDEFGGYLVGGRRRPSLT